MKLPSQSSKKEFNLYLLCHYCLLKVRSICDIFGFLRELKMGVWNLEKVSNSSIDIKEQPLSQSTTRRKRSSSRAAKRVSMISDAFNIWSMNSSMDDPTKGSDMVIETTQNENGCINTKITPILDIEDNTIHKDTVNQLIEQESLKDSVESLKQSVDSLKETTESIQELSINKSLTPDMNISEIDNAVDKILENVTEDEVEEEEQSGFDFEEYESSLPTSPV
ncbi:unnamed protein product [Hanseniaspora opuntiae]